jgi:hypothetical protein
MGLNENAQGKMCINILGKGAIRFHFIVGNKLLLFFCLF